MVFFLDKTYQSISPNEQKYVQAWDLKNVRLESLLIKKQMYKFITNVQRCLSSPSWSTIKKKKPIVISSDQPARLVPTFRENPMLAEVYFLVNS